MLNYCQEFSGIDSSLTHIKYLSPKVSKAQYQRPKACPGNGKWVFGSNYSNRLLCQHRDGKESQRGGLGSGSINVGAVINHSAWCAVCTSHRQGEPSPTHLSDEEAEVRKRFM